ncbi:MAG: endonuclease/exonuclease/phosphatase family protein [Patescibacteria group bacterium]|jgi:endonuclease/exonuclease/phosphatase family metal-dependent hydrolase
MDGSRLRLLTLNTGLFRLRIGPWSFLDPIPHTAARIHHIADAVRVHQPDVIAFQEVFADRDLDRLHNELAADYPHYASSRDHIPSPRIRAHSGLCVFSRFPLKNQRHEMFQDTSLDERLFVGRGFLAANVESPIGVVSVFNMHLTSGGIFRDPRGAAFVGIRNNQVDQLTAAGNAATSPIRIILGDLNAGPAVSEENYARVLANGFRDSWDLHPETITRLKHVTWENANPLTGRELHKTEAPQRIDHIFLHPDTLNHVTVGRAEIVLHEPRVMTPRGLVTVSDHYGVLVDLEKKI